jgi:hypothetical protein
MDWLSSLPFREIVINKKERKKRPIIKLANGVSEYKHQYYIDNYTKYMERNRKASEERTIKRIQELTNPSTIHKIKYILDNDNGC